MHVYMHGVMVCIYVCVCVCVCVFGGPRAAVNQRWWVSRFPASVGGGDDS